MLIVFALIGFMVCLFVATVGLTLAVYAICDAIEDWREDRKK